MIKYKNSQVLWTLFLIISAWFVFKRYVYDIRVEVNNEIKCHKNHLIIKHILKAIHKSHRYVTKIELLKVLSLLSNNIEQDQSHFRHNRIKEVELTKDLQDVCLEEFKGVIDHPLYNQGQIEIKCKKKPFEDVLTFVVMVDNCMEIEEIESGIQQLYNKSKIFIGQSFGLSCQSKKNQNVELFQLTNNINDLSAIFNNISTEYVLFAPNIYHFDNQSKIERLVQMVSYTNTKIAAGSTRLENGRYSNACYQMAMKMYTLKLVEGYDMSFNSCLYCDYSPAPFVTRTSFMIEQLKQKTFFDKNTFMLDLFNDLILSKNSQIFVCPDVMFHTKSFDLSEHKKETWLPFVRKYELNRIILPGGKDINFTCSETKMSCYKKKGLMVPLCCLKDLSDSLKFMNKLLESQNVTFEVLEGTVMGGLKYNNILFWERDADTNFRVQRIEKLEEKLDVIKQRGYSMEITYECPYKRDHEKCRLAGWHGSIYYAFKTPNWRTEMYGVTFILSDFRGKLKVPTKINIDGEWYITYTNPALYGRNIYGGDIFQHIEHYSDLGISHKEYSKLFRGNFQPCPRPGFHGCLDNFVGEGSLQFLDIYL